MKASRFSEIHPTQDADGLSVANWNKKYGLPTTMRRLKRLEGENSKLRRWSPSLARRCCRTRSAEGFEVVRRRTRGMYQSGEHAGNPALGSLV